MPSAWRSSDSTMTMRVKPVISSSTAGRKVSDGEQQQRLHRQRIALAAAGRRGAGEAAESRPPAPDRGTGNQAATASARDASHEEPSQERNTHPGLAGASASPFRRRLCAWPSPGAVRSGVASAGTGCGSVDLGSVCNALTRPGGDAEHQPAVARFRRSRRARAGRRSARRRLDREIPAAATHGRRSGAASHAAPQIRPSTSARPSVACSSPGAHEPGAGAPAAAACARRSGADHARKGARARRGFIA